MSPNLSVVAANDPTRELLSDRIRRLQAEAKGLARENVLSLEEKLIDIQRMAMEIADGGEAYAVGVRELARRLAEDCEHRVQTLEAITQRG